MTAANRDDADGFVDIPVWTNPRPRSPAKPSDRFDLDRARRALVDLYTAAAGSDVLGAAVYRGGVATDATGQLAIAPATIIAAGKHLVALHARIESIFAELGDALDIDGIGEFEQHLTNITGTSEAAGGDA